MAELKTMDQSYGKGWSVLHYRNICNQRYENIHEVRLSDGTLVARLCSECDCVTYCDWEY